MLAHQHEEAVVKVGSLLGRRSETDDLSAAQIFYPCMQCADIFFLKVRPPLHVRRGTSHVELQRVPCRAVPS